MTAKKTNCTLTDDKITAIMETVFYENEKAACENFNLSPETLNRYKREFKGRFPDRYKKLVTLYTLHDSFTPEELKTIIQSAGNGPAIERIIKRNFSGDRIKFGHMTDTHIGSIYFDEGYFLSALDEMEKQGCQFICHTGDVTDGLSNRPNHIYELNRIGYEAQKKYALDLFRRWEKPIYMISGNHDDYYINNAGAYIVKDICEELKQAEYCGESTGQIEINNIKFDLWHGLDSSSYATSYRVQKIIEAYSGGDKPQILLCGHTHKTIYMLSRNIHAVSGGALSRQSKFMKGKRLENHTGFWIVEMNIKNKEILSFKTEFYPFYK